MLPYIQISGTAYCHPAYLFLIPIRRILFLQFRKYPQYDYRTYCASDYTADSTIQIQSEEAEQPAAYDTAKNTKEEVNPAAAALTLLQFACYIAANNTNDNSFNHN